MIPASVHFVQTLEGIVWTIKAGYKGWIYLNVFPRRYEPVQTLSTSVRTVKKMFGLVQKLGPDKLLEDMKERDYLKGVSLFFKN